MVEWYHPLYQGLNLRMESIGRTYVFRVGMRKSDMIMEPISRKVSNSTRPSSRCRQVLIPFPDLILAHVSFFPYEKMSWD